VNLTALVAVFVGGGLGAVSRYGLSIWARHQAPAAVMPWGTLAANLIGCALLGVLGGLLQHVDVDPALKLGLTTGVLGGLTTFSTFSYETVQLAQAGRWSLAGVNLVTNLLLGLALAALGAWVGHRLGLRIAG